MGYGTVIESVPEMFEYVAVITAEPLAIPVTSPVDDTVAIAVFEEVQVAVVVTSSTPPDTVAVAANCAVVPTVGGVPLIVIAETVVADVGEPHAAAHKPRVRTRLAIRTDRIDI